MKLLMQMAITLFNAGISIVGYFYGVDSPTMDRAVIEVRNCFEKSAPNIDKNTALVGMTKEKHLSEKFDAAFYNDFDQLVKKRLDRSDDTWKIKKKNLHAFRNWLSAIKDGLKIPRNSTTYFPWSFWREIRENAIADEIAYDIADYFSKKCPPPYFNFGGGCIVILPFTKVTWMEAREACETHNGTLFTFRKKTHYKSLRYSLKRRVDNLHRDDKHFWIGGHINSDELLGSSKWTWIDNTDMEMKSPVWGVYMEESCNATNKCNYNFYFASASQETRKGDCLAMDNDFDFFFSDQSCLEKRYPVCLLKEH